MSGEFHTTRAPTLKASFHLYRGATPSKALSTLTTTVADVDRAFAEFGDKLSQFPATIAAEFGD